MNLAELRKKAQKGKEKATNSSPVASVYEIELVPEDTTEETVTAEPLPEVLTTGVDEEGDTLLTSTSVPKEADVVERSPASTDHVTVHAAFDPLGVLLAGRKMALADEGASLDTAAVVEADGEGFHEFLCFRVTSEVYAINIMAIKEIIKPREVTEVPRAPAFVSGVLSLRGIIIPVFDMGLRLGLPVVEKSPKERIVVLKSGEEFFGIVVDEVIQVVRLAASSIEKPPAVLDGIDRDFVSGIGHFDGQMLILLNQEKILDLTLV